LYNSDINLKKDHNKSQKTVNLILNFLSLEFDYFNNIITILLLFIYK